MNTNNLISMNNSLKTMQMQNAFQQRLVSGDMTRDLYSPTSSQTTEEDNGRLELIRAKLQYGGKLTDKEREYLKHKDPKAYADLLRDEEDQRLYERALRRCRTRDEAQHLKLGRITRSLDTIKATEKDASLSKEEKLAVTSRELRAINHAIKTTSEYLRTGKLSKNSSTSTAAEEKLRDLLSDRMEELLSRAAERDSKRYDTFVSTSRTFEDIQNDAIEAIKNLYATETECSDA